MILKAIGWTLRVEEHPNLPLKHCGEVEIRCVLAFVFFDSRVKGHRKRGRVLIEYSPSLVPHSVTVYLYLPLVTVSATLRTCLHARFDSFGCVHAQVSHVLTNCLV